MTKNLIISSAAIVSLASVAAAMGTALEDVFASASADEQLSLPLEGTDQAIEAFMYERDELKADLFAHELAVDAFMIERAELKADLLAHEMAVEAFMEERSENTVAMRQAALAIEHQSKTIAQQRKTIEQNNVAFAQIGNFANALQNALNEIGVRYQADPETGSPLIELQPEALAAAINSVMPRNVPLAS